MTHPNSEALKDCPFCGSDDIELEFGSGYKNGDVTKPFVFPGCNNCSATAESAAAWNTRTPAQPVEPSWSEKATSFMKSVVPDNLDERQPCVAPLGEDEAVQIMGDAIWHAREVDCHQSQCYAAARDAYKAIKPYLTAPKSIASKEHIVDVLTRNGPPKPITGVQLAMISALREIANDCEYGAGSRARNKAKAAVTLYDAQPQGGEGEWRDIESAPKDGTEITGGWLAPFNDYTGTPLAWQVSENKHGWFMLSPMGRHESGILGTYPGKWVGDKESPTHWRPLIKPPLTKEQS